MKILIYGTGAVGGYYGLRLLQAGYDITFAARGAIYEKICDCGLTIDSYRTGIAEFKNIKLINTAQIETITDKFDIIIFALKSYDTKSNLENLKKLLSDSGIVLSFQNGVENEDLIAEKLGVEKVIGAAVFIAAAVENKNIIKHTGADKIVFGALSEKFDKDLLLSLKKMFDNAGVENILSDNIKKDKWTKLIWNASFNSVSVVLNAVVMDMVTNEYSSALLRQVMSEVIDTAAAQNIIIDKKIIDKYLSIEENIGEFKTSMLQDFEKGKKLEFDFFNGAVIRAAEKYGVDTPANKFLYSVLSFIEWKQTK